MATKPSGSPIRLNVSFIGVDSETMLMALDLEGVCASMRFGLHGWLSKSVACFARHGIANGTRKIGHSLFRLAD